MKNQVHRIVWWCDQPRLVVALAFCGFFLAHCAQVGTPKGGAKDTTAPKIVAARSTPNLLTNFQATEIVLTFDEWVVLQNVGTQVVVSPPLAKRPDVRLKKRSVVLNLEGESLKPDVTYTINFGAAVKDLTEGNVPENLRFVFSTGSFIDSLAFSGQVTDAFSLKPVKDALVALYEGGDSDDSLPHREPPFYLTRTDAEGGFRLENLKAGRFRVVIFIDQNLNMRFDGSESVAFLDTLLLLDGQLGRERTAAFRLSPNDAGLKRISALQENYGHIKLVFNQFLFDTLALTHPTFAKTHTEYEADTLHIWYNDTASKRVTVLHLPESLAPDTVVTLSPSRGVFFKKYPRLLPSRPVSKKVIAHNPAEPMVVRWQRPVANLLADSVLLLQDTTLTLIKGAAVVYGTHSRRVVEVRHRLKENTPYRLVFLPKAATDWHGRTNDTLVLDYKTLWHKDFGTIDIEVSVLDSARHYVVELVNADYKTIRKFSTQGQTVFRQRLEAMTAGRYALRVIEDADANRRWTTARYPMRAPEVVHLSNVADLRANWELELRLKLR